MESKFEKMMERAKRKTHERMKAWFRQHERADIIVEDKVTGMPMRAVYFAPVWQVYEDEKALDFQLRQHNPTADEERERFWRPQNPRSG